MGKESFKKQEGPGGNLAIHRDLYRAKSEKWKEWREVKIHARSARRKEIKAQSDGNHL
jgi:hypothetical protein